MSDYDIIVIGSGAGGLTAAVALAALLLTPLARASQAEAREGPEQVIERLDAVLVSSLEGIEKPAICAIFSGD